MYDSQAGKARAPPSVVAAGARRCPSCRQHCASDWQAPLCSCWFIDGCVPIGHTDGAPACEGNIGGKLLLTCDRWSLDVSGGGTNGTALPGFTSQPQNAMALHRTLERSLQTSLRAQGRGGEEGVCTARSHCMVAVMGRPSYMKLVLMVIPAVMERLWRSGSSSSSCCARIVLACKACRLT